MKKVLTKKPFESLLKKAAQPKKQFDSKGIQISVAHPSDNLSIIVLPVINTNSKANNNQD